MKFPLKKLAVSALATIAFLTFAPFALLAGGQGLDSLAFSSPAGYISETTVAAITAAVTTLLAFFSGLFPYLKKISDTTIRSIVTGFIVLVGAAVFKLGFVSDETLKFALDGLLPNFAYSTLIYKGLQGIVALLRVLNVLPPSAEFKSLAPASAKKSKKA